MTNDKSCAVCGQPIRDGESHSRMGIGVGADPRYRHGHVMGDLRPCLNAAIARAKAAEAEAAIAADLLTAENAALRAQLAEEEWLPIGTFDGEFGEWWVWNGIEVARGYYGYEQWWDEWPGYDAARPLRAQPTHYCAVRQPAPPQE